MNCEIYIYTHKDFNPIVSNPCYKILTEVDLPEKNMETINVNTGDNIKRFESCYSELKGFYWVWKNIKNLPDFIGFNHYRRYFDFLDNIIELDKDDILLPYPYRFNSVSNQYASCHNIDDLTECCNVLCELYPEYKETVEYTLNSHELYYANCFIMSKENYLKYMEWLFNVLFAYDQKMGFNSYNDVKKYVDNLNRCHVKGNEYQYRIQAFLSERLFTIYINHNFKPERIKYFNYVMI